MKFIKSLETINGIDSGGRRAYVGGPDARQRPDEKCCPRSGILLEELEGVRHAPKDLINHLLAVKCGDDRKLLPLIVQRVARQRFVKLDASASRVKGAIDPFVQEQSQQPHNVAESRVVLRCVLIYHTFVGTNRHEALGSGDGLPRPFPLHLGQYGNDAFFDIASLPHHFGRRHALHVRPQSGDAVCDLARPGQPAVAVDDILGALLKTGKLWWDGNVTHPATGSDVHAGVVEQSLAELGFQLLLAPEIQQGCRAVDVGGPALRRLTASKCQRLEGREKQDTQERAVADGSVRCTQRFVCVCQRLGVLAAGHAHQFRLPRLRGQERHGGGLRRSLDNFVILQVHPQPGKIGKGPYWGERHHETAQGRLLRVDLQGARKAVHVGWAEPRRLVCVRATCWPTRPLIFLLLRLANR